MGGLLLSTLGPLGICMMFLVLGELSRRLGRVTRVRAYHRGFYFSALLMGLNTLLHVLLAVGVPLPAVLRSEGVLMVVFAGFPALSLTIGLGVAWRYWSWLLAERA